MLGQCNCGAVEFSINQPITDVYVCHCSICRRSTGAGGKAVVIVDNEHFSWIKGTDKVNTWHKPEHDWLTSFCSCCGTPLPGKNSDSSLYVPVSLLPDQPLKVTHHIWVGSKAPWEEIGDDGVQHPQAFCSSD